MYVYQSLERLSIVGGGGEEGVVYSSKSASFPPCSSIYPFFLLHGARLMFALVAFCTITSPNGRSRSSSGT